MDVVSGGCSKTTVTRIEVNRSRTGETRILSAWSDCIVVDGDQRGVFVTDRNPRLAVEVFPLGVRPG